DRAEQLGAVRAETREEGRRVEPLGCRVGIERASVRPEGRGQTLEGDVRRDHAAGPVRAEGERLRRRQRGPDVPWVRELAQGGYVVLDVLRPKAGAALDGLDGLQAEVGRGHRR